MKEALQFREKKMTELAYETNISKQSLSLYANGGNIPPFENVIKIAKALSFPIDFFMIEDGVLRLQEIHISGHRRQQGKNLELLK